MMPISTNNLSLPDWIFKPSLNCFFRFCLFFANFISLTSLSILTTLKTFCTRGALKSTFAPWLPSLLISEAYPVSK